MAWSQLYNFGGININSVVTDDGDRLYYVPGTSNTPFYYSTWAWIVLGLYFD